MKRVFLILAIAALALPSSAFGKGPSEASMNGPGGGGGITFTGDGESGGTSLGNLAEQSGFYSAVFPAQPDPMLDTRPEGDLGPRVHDHVHRAGAQQRDLEDPAGRLSVRDAWAGDLHGAWAGDLRAERNPRRLVPGRSTAERDPRLRGPPSLGACRYLRRHLVPDRPPGPAGLRAVARRDGPRRSPPRASVGCLSSRSAIRRQLRDRRSD